MDFMLEDELIDLMAFCLQNLESAEAAEKIIIFVLDLKLIFFLDMLFDQ
jgi:hypothetical protein